MLFSTQSRWGALFSGLFDRGVDATGEMPDGTMQDLCAALLATNSEQQERRLAQAILLKYHSGSDADHRETFQYWLHELDLDIADLGAAVLAYQAIPTPQAYADMTRTMRAPRIDLFQKLAQLTGGTKCLVKIREDIRVAMKTDPDLKRLDHDLFELLCAWFNRGFLMLQPITWESPAHILEKIIAYEAVHAIQDWNDLRRRLQPADRRCYGFFHPRMPDDPIIFVEVALTNTIPTSVDALLAEEREQPAFDTLKTATFYSISNCHAGLAGISFGNALIKQVVRLLKQELPQLNTFVTLSPVPGLSKWADGADMTPTLAANYLTQAKRPDGGPLDPVARFHLGNGALLHAVHADANSSPAGQKQSGGIMVNYLYDLGHVDQNTDRFAEHHHVAISKDVKALLKP